MINRAKFYDHIRFLFGGHLTGTQVAGMEAILNEWMLRELTDLRWLAYTFGTTYWETARTMYPVREYGRGRNHAYGKPDPVTGLVYYGRGFVQLTWKGNYASMGAHLKIDLLHKPDLALDLNIATKILFEGMTLGMFTGKKLSDYFGPDHEDWIGARHIINGTDKAATIASFSKNFHEALLLE